MKLTCITCGEIIGSVYWELESGDIACNNCYWKDFAEHLTPIIQKGTIKGPTKEDFSLNFDRDPEWDNAVRIANALAIVEDYQSTLYGKNSLTKPDVGIMLSRIAEALEDDLC